MTDTKTVWVSIPCLNEACIKHFYIRVPSSLSEADEREIGHELIDQGVEPTLVVTLTPTSSGFPPPGTEAALRQHTIEPIVVTPTVEEKPQLYIASRFPNGFPNERQRFMGWLRHAGIASTGTWEGGTYLVLVDEANLGCLNELCKAQPQIYGNPKPKEPYNA